MGCNRPKSGGLADKQKSKYDGFFEKFKVFGLVFRVLITIAVSLVFLPWQGAWSVETAEAEGVASNTAVSTSVFRVQSEMLQEALRWHRALAGEGGWAPVPGGPTIRPDAEDPRLATLAMRLAQSGDLPDRDGTVSTSKYDDTLQEGVRRFQARHGLEVDALVGRRTLRALNVSIERRIDQLRVNLERMRRLADIESNDFVLVNIAAFKAYVVRDREIVWTTKVIVGEKDDETPEFHSALSHVVFNPTWTVPYSIASEELLPKIKSDPGFFAKGGYELFVRDGDRVDPSAVEWSSIGIGNFPFTIVQRPGPATQLGEVKFMFPNEYSVCMHDTPARSLFDKAARAFSHGCIRVDEPRGFAEVLLARDGWTREQVDAAIETGKTRTIGLPEPLPMYVSYWTAEVDDFGHVHFYDDLYERDAAILGKLNATLPGN